MVKEAEGAVGKYSTVEEEHGELREAEGYHLDQSDCRVGVKVDPVCRRFDDMALRIFLYVSAEIPIHDIL